MKQNIVIYPDSKSIRIESPQGCGITLEYEKVTLIHPDKIEIVLAYNNVDIINLLRNHTG